MLKYIRIYADSVESPDGKDKLLRYLENNRQGVEIPEHGEGMAYKHMGVQENQILKD